VHEVSIWIWAAFLAFVAAMLALDLGLFQRKAHAVSVREAAIWSAVWIGLALLFSLGLYLWQGPDASLRFLSGYLIEKALSVDNLFVFALIFTFFAVPAQYQHRVLFWGVLGALLTRGLFIAAGAALITRFSWITYFFGAFLLFTALRLAFSGEAEVHPERNALVRLARRVMPITRDYHGQSFFVRQGKLMATPLLIVLLVIESSDVMFAVDSIPAIFAVTNDPFLVFTSNVFAILGLRSLYFVLAKALDQLHYLKLALAGILGFVGVKMLIAEWIHLPAAASLGVIAALLAGAVVASVVRARRLATRAGEEEAA
jgi:tellurite resistance protein TerC